MNVTYSYIRSTEIHKSGLPDTSKNLLKSLIERNKSQKHRKNGIKKVQIKREKQNDRIFSAPAVLISFPIKLSSTSGATFVNDTFIALPFFLFVEEVKKKKIRERQCCQLKNVSDKLLKVVYSRFFICEGATLSINPLTAYLTAVFKTRSTLHSSLRTVQCMVHKKKK